MAAGAERAVGLERHTPLLTRLEQSPPVLERAELQLVQHGRGLGDRQHVVELAHAEVRHADRARVAALQCTFHAGPGPGRPALRPVDDVEVHLVDVQPFQAPLGLGLRVLPRRIELGSYEDLFARHAAVAQRAADALLVAVGLRSVDVAVAELERPANRVLALPPVRNLPDAEAEKRDLVAVGEYARASIFGHWSGCHCGSSSRGKRCREGNDARDGRPQAAECGLRVLDTCPPSDVPRSWLSMTSPPCWARSPGICAAALESATGS